MQSKVQVRPRGVTLVELLTVVAVLAILSTIAVTAYRSHVVRTNRTDATATLLRVQVAQEKYFLQHNVYADNVTTQLGFDTGLAISATSSDPFGTSLQINRTVSLLPFGSVAFAHTRAAVKVNNNSTSASDNYMLLGFGAGFQLSPSLVLRPALSLAAGADLTDDTVFGFSVTWALPR